MSSNNHKKLIGASLVTGLGLATIPTISIITIAAALATISITAPAFATTSTSGQVQLNTEVSTSIAMKIASPNDTNPDCIAQSGVTYGVANRYATSNGAEGSKQVDTFDGTTGGADEVNTNTSCATLTMTPNTFSSTYSDVTVYTNSPNGYALSLRSATGASPNLVNLDDDTVYIPAGALTEVDGTGAQAGTKVVPGAQNKWAYKTDNNGNIDSWTAVTTTDATIRAYDMETNNGSNTRVTYGISAGNNPNGRYGTTLTYTATMFDGDNPHVPAALISDGEDCEGDNCNSNFDTDTNKLKVPYNTTRTLTVTPKEGHYISSIVCSNGYTCTDENGDGLTLGTSAINPIMVYVTNTNKEGTGTITITTGTSEYPVTIAGNPNNDANSLTLSTSNLSIPYGESRTVTVTPATGYYLSGVSCLNGYICAAETPVTGTNNNVTLGGLFTAPVNALGETNPIQTGEDATGPQTVRITNNNTVGGGSVSFSTAKKSYDVAIAPSLYASTSTNSLKIPYGESRTFTITPNSGYYLTGVTCSSGYTCSGYTTGSASNPNATSRGTQTITVTNNSSTNTGAVSFTLANTYRISFSKTNMSSPSSSYVDVAYGGSTNVTVTPASGYYLSAFSGCPSGWTCSGIGTGTGYTGAQTLTLTNNSSVNTGTLTMTGTTSDPWVVAGCDSATKNNPCTVNGVQYIRLADGHYWTKYIQGTSDWRDSNAPASKCPAGTILPSSDDFVKLIDAYNSRNNGNLYAATGWSGWHWTSTVRENNFRDCFWVSDHDAGTGNHYDYRNVRGAEERILCRH